MPERRTRALLIGLPGELAALWPALLPAQMEVTAVASVADARGCLATHPFEIIVLDASIPDANAIYQSRERNASALVVVGNEPAPFADETLRSDQCEGEMARKLVHQLLDNQRVRRQLTIAQRMRSVGQFARGMAHEYNNLLTGVIGYSELLQQEPGARDLVEMSLPEILRAAHQMALLTQQLRAFGRRKLGRQETLDLEAFLTEMLPVWQRELGPDYVLRITPPTSPVLIKADPSALETILDELLTNSQEAMPQGGNIVLSMENLTVPTPRFPTSNDWQGGAYGLLQIHDSGEGIGKELHERVFEPFFTTRTAGSGGGMGLTVARGITKQMHGFIVADTHPQSGALLSLLLPTAS